MKKEKYTIDKCCILRNTEVKVKTKYIRFCFDLQFNFKISFWITQSQKKFWLSRL